VINVFNRFFHDSTRREVTAEAIKRPDQQLSTCAAADPDALKIYGRLAGVLSPSENYV
jgi:hypothetical protein